MSDYETDLIEALEFYASLLEDLNRYGMISELAEAALRKDRGKRALEAIAKAKEEA